jgi:hypothetical protein
LIARTAPSAYSTVQELPRALPVIGRRDLRELGHQRVVTLLYQLRH